MIVFISPGSAAFRNMLLVLLCCLALLPCLAGCGSRDGRILAQELADSQDMESVAFYANGFTMRGFLRAPRRQGASRSMAVYIEGDGHAYENRSTPSLDPTPDNPMSLRLALADPAATVLYLGRPCQFTRGEECSMRYWTLDRYAPVTVDAMSQALDQAKKRTGADLLYLAGYSGGGAMAALLAARRDDVAGLATVAGNLDHALWTKLHEVSPLRGSLNPADDAKRLRNVPQVHFVGDRDAIVPEEVAESYMQQLENADKARLVLVDADHTCCWPALWPGLLRQWGPKWGR